MEMTSDLGNGIGSTTIEDPKSAFQSLLDSENGATQSEVDATPETTDDDSDDVSDTSNDEAEADEIESSDQTDDADKDAETEEETDETESDDSNVITLKDGEFIEIDGERLSAFDLKDRLMLKADFTRRTQELAQERKAYVENRVDLTGLNRDYATNLNQIQEVLYTALPELTEPNWDELRENDPHTYLKEQARWEKIKTAINAMNQERDRVAQEEKKSQALLRAQAQQNAYDNLIKFVPEFKEPQAAKANLERVERFLRDECHFEQDLIDGISDPRLIVLALDAANWREHKKKIPQAVKRVEQKPALAPSTGPAGDRKSSTRSTFDQKVREAQKTGNARGLFLHLLDNE